MGGGDGMKKAIAWVLATWFGCGLCPIAPGTAGSLGALPLWFALRGHGPASVLLAAFVLTIAGAWAAGIVADAKRMVDPQIVVIDETAGVLIALAAAPSTTRGAFAAVVAFRFFDIVKPFPARSAERLPRGWGIMMDDVAAGVWAAAVVLVLRAIDIVR